MGTVRGDGRTKKEKGGGGGGRVVRSVKANGITEELVFLRWPLSVTRRRKEEEERGRVGVVGVFYQLLCLVRTGGVAVGVLNIVSYPLFSRN